MEVAKFEVHVYDDPVLPGKPLIERKKVAEVATLIEVKSHGKPLCYQESLQVTVDQLEYSLQTITFLGFMQYPEVTYSEQPEAYAQQISDLYLLAQSRPINTLTHHEIEQFFAEHQLSVGCSHLAGKIIDFLQASKYIKACEDAHERQMRTVANNEGGEK